MWRFCTVWIVAGTLQTQVNVTVWFIFFNRKLIVLMADLVAIFGVILISEMKELGA